MNSIVPYAFSLYMKWEYFWIYFKIHLQTIIWELTSNLKLPIFSACRSVVPMPNTALRLSTPMSSSDRTAKWRGCHMESTDLLVTWTSSTFPSTSRSAKWNGPVGHTTATRWSFVLHLFCFENTFFRMRCQKWFFNKVTLIDRSSLVLLSIFIKIILWVLKI